MQTFILRFPSVTYAQKGQRVLEQKGYRSRLTRVGTHGCSYGLELNDYDRTEILRILEDAGVIFTL